MYIDFFTVVLASLVYVIVEGLWYSSFLFQKLWRQCTSLVDEKKGFFFYVSNFCIAFLIAFFLAFFESYLEVTSFWDGVIVGFLAWLGFVMTTQLSCTIRQKKSWTLFFLENGCYLFNFMVVGGILAGWSFWYWIYATIGRWSEASLARWYTYP